MGHTGPYGSHATYMSHLWNLRNLRIVLLSLPLHAFTKNTTCARHARLFAGRRAQA